MSKRIVYRFLAALLGLVFIFSALLKLYPAEILEIAIVETGVMGWALAPFAARLLIAMELFLGILLLSALYARFFVKVSIGVLAFFTLYLAWLLIKEGNNSNCNCFGLLLPVSPLASVVKNLGMMLLLLFLVKKDYGCVWKYSRIFVITAIVLSSLASFALSPIVISRYKPDANELNYSLNLSLVYDDPQAEKPAVDLRKGKWIIVFLSSQCTHCKLAGFKFHVLKQHIPEMPVFFFINGDEENIRDFFISTRAEHIPHCNISARSLIQMAGLHLPAIVWIEDGVVVNKSTLYGTKEEDIRNWMKK
jgi:hypothetical protein